MNKTIAVIYNGDKPETETAAKEVVDYIRGYCDVVINPQTYHVGIGAAIVFGGDGSLLHVANKAARCGIPIIGVNYGNLGYLCKLKKDELTYSVLDKIIKGDYTCEYRTRISAEISYPTGRHLWFDTVDALNEIAIGGITRTVYLRLLVNRKFSKLVSIESVGDGIIFSTETGSTAYNVNAGGSVLLEDAFSVVLNNKSRIKSTDVPENTKSLVTSIDTVFEVEITNSKADNLPYIIADGQRDFRLTGKEKIVIKKSKYDTKFIIIGNEHE